MSNYTLEESVNIINDNIDNIINNIDNPNYDKVIDSCNPYSKEKFNYLKYNKIYTLLISIFIFITIVKLLNTINTKYLKVLKSLLLLPILIVITVVYIIIKIFIYGLPFTKTKIYNTGKFDDKYISEILKNYKTYSKEQLLNIYNELSNLESKYINNKDIIKYFLKKNNYIVKNNYRTIDYRRYLFNLKEFKIINFNILFKKPLHNLNKVNRDEIIKNNIKNDLWKNTFINKINKEIYNKNKKKNILNIISYYLSELFIYNWPNIFDYYIDNDKIRHIEDEYKNII